MKNEMALDLRTGALVKLSSPEELLEEYKTDTKENTRMAKKKKHYYYSLMVEMDAQKYIMKYHK